MYVKNILNIEFWLCILKICVLQVFLTEYRLLHWYAPVDAKRLVLDIDAAISFGMIELIAFVLEDGSFGENGKAMGKTTRDEELETDD